MQDPDLSWFSSLPGRAKVYRERTKTNMVLYLVQM